MLGGCGTKLLNTNNLYEDYSVRLGGNALSSFTPVAYGFGHLSDRKPHAIIVEHLDASSCSNGIGGERETTAGN